MGSINSIVNINISRETTAVTQAGFGTLAFLSNQASFTGRIKQYADMTEVTGDLQAGADTLIAAAKYFGQPLKPTAFYVIKKKRDVKEVYDLVFSADFVALNVIDMDINTVAITPVTFATDQATTLGLLATELAGHAAVDTAVATGTRTIRITGLTAGLTLLIENILVTLGASQATGAATLITEGDVVGTNEESITEAIQENNDWYSLAMYDRTKANILLMAAYIQPLKKIFLSCNNDADVLTTATTDVATALQAAAYDRTSFMWSDDFANYPEVAWAGNVLPLEAGSETWKFRTLVGITYDNLTSSQEANAKAKGANVYTRVAGVNITSEGVMASGEFIDVMRGVDWIDARMGEEVFSVFVNNNKIPFTNNGVNIIYNAINKVLIRAVGYGILAADPAFTITAPLVADISTNNKANRLLPDVKFSGVLEGAVHKTNINGTVSV